MSTMSGYARNFRYPLIKTKLPGIEHGNRSDSGYVAQINFNDCFDP